MIFITKSNSRYELDRENKRVRRLSGNANPTNRQGEDGQWKGYEIISSVEVGRGVTIIWPSSTPLLPETENWQKKTGGFAIPTTYTSDVVSIEEG